MRALPEPFVRWLLGIALLGAPLLPMNAQIPAAGPLPSSAFDFAQLTVKPTPVGSYRAVVDRPTATFERMECHITTLNPGEKSHPPHHHPQEEFIVLREGTLDASINGVVTRVGPGSVLFFASQDVHNVTNVGKTPAQYVVLNVTTAATHRVPGKPAAESAAPTALKSAALEWAKLPVKPSRTGFRREILDGPTATFAHFEAHATTIGPGDIPHPPHHHPDEEIILIQDGILEARFDGATHRCGPGSVLFYASNQEHGMRNVGSVPATYYVIRIVTAATPAPDRT